MVFVALGLWKSGVLNYPKYCKVYGKVVGNWSFGGMVFAIFWSRTGHQAHEEQTQDFHFAGGFGKSKIRAGTKQMAGSPPFAM